MAFQQHSASHSPSTLLLGDLKIHIRGWIMDAEYEMLSPRTLEARKIFAEKFVWFLEREQFLEVGPLELKAFLSYLVTGHLKPGGRWEPAEEGKAARAKKPLAPSSVKTWYNQLRIFCNYLVKEEMLAVSPLAKIRPPVDRPDQLQAFTEPQTRALVEAAKQTRNHLRDEALVLFLLDTGVRASELCALRVRDVDLGARHCRVEGKGGKARSVYFGRAASRALWIYIRSRQNLDENEPLFPSEQPGPTTDGLGRVGLCVIIHRLGDAAGIQGVRCSPHTFRRTFATRFIALGGNVFTLQQLMGHSNLSQTQKYCTVAQADMATQHRTFSPADALFRHKK